MDQGRGGRGRAAASATRSTSRSGRRRRRGRTPPGTRPGAAAGPAGTSSARRWRRRCSASASTSTAAARTSSSPTTRTRRRRRRAARGEPLTRLWMHNGMVRLEGEKMAKSVGNIFLLHEALAAHGRDALVALLLRRPLPPADRLLARSGSAEAARSVERISDAGRRLVAGASPAELAPLREAFFDALADDFNTPRALATVFEWVREANRRAEAGEPVGDADLREMLGVFALDGLLDADAAGGGPDAAAQELLGAPRGGARRARLRRGRPPARRAGRARLGGPRRRRTARRSSRARRDPLRPQRRARGAARAARRAARCGRPSAAAREPWLRGAAASVRTAHGEELERRCGSPDHQGICAEVARVPLRRRGRAAGAARTR